MVTTVKDLFVSGLSKIKGLINTAREKSKTSRASRGRSRGRGESLSDDSSLDRYRTPMGRSKSRAQSRGFSKVVPMNTEEYQGYEDEGRRHVNFNVNRVVQL